MKLSFLKIVLIILIIGLVLVGLYINYFDKEEIMQTGEFIQIDNKDRIISNNIRIGIIEFDNINPILSNNKNVQDISRLIFDSLFTLTQEYRLEPSLATEFSKLNDTTYIIKLREDVKWHDGKEFNVSDVIFTINMLKKNNSIYSNNVANILSLEEIDEYTLKIIINQKIPEFEYNFIFPIISSKYFTEDNLKTESKNLKIVGTGMFYISDVSNNSILLKKNTIGWENRKLNVDSINLNLYNSLSNTINAFKTGDIDIFTTSNIQIEEYLKNTIYNKKEYINRNYDYLIINCKNNVLVNKEVRQAINFSINKDEIIKQVYNNKYIKSNFPLDFGNYVYTRNDTTIVYDSNMVNALLIDNGWEFSSKKWKKIVGDKQLTIELSLLVNKNSSNLVKVANNIKEQLEEVGIIINIIELAKEQFERNLSNKQYDIVLMSSNYGYSPSLNKYFKDGNLANFKNKEAINLLNEIENITNENEIKQKYTRIVEIYNNEVPYISLYYNTNTIIYSANLKGTITPNSYNLFYNIETWYREYKNN